MFDNKKRDMVELQDLLIDTKSFTVLNFYGHNKKKINTLYIDEVSIIENEIYFRLEGHSIGNTLIDNIRYFVLGSEEDKVINTINIFYK